MYSGFLTLFFQGGNTNRGNIVNKFFLHPKITSRILRIPKRLLKFIWRLLVNLNQTHHVPDSSEYQRVGRKALEVYKRAYGDYKIMTAQIHSTLVHGHSFIDAAKELGLTPGELTEASLEYGHQDKKRIQKRNARMDSFLHESEDMMHGLYISNISLSIGKS